MKKILFSFLVYFTFTLNIFAQSLSIEDIEKLVWMNSSDKQDFLITKGFDFWRKRDFNVSNQDVSNIDYGKGKVSNGNLYHYSELFSYFDKKQTELLHNITYSTYSSSHYLTIKKYVKLYYKWQSSDDGIEVYKKGKVTITFQSLRDDLDNTRWIIGSFHDI